MHPIAVVGVCTEVVGSPAQNLLTAFGGMTGAHFPATFFPAAGKSMAASILACVALSAQLLVPWSLLSWLIPKFGKPFRFSL